jgi:4'-phosphopantetheinyl transferase
VVAEAAGATPHLGGLSPSEADRARAFRDPADGRRFAAFRAALRSILGDYLGLPPAAVPIGVAPSGKPRLAPAAVSDGAPPLVFSLAHAAGFGLVAVAREPVGVDIETAAAARFEPRLAPRVLSAAERAVHTALPPDTRAGAFLRLWTRKEAYLKATGEGLARDPATVTVSADETARLIAVDGRPGEAARWHLHHLEPWPGTVGALATTAVVGQAACRVVRFDWVSPPTGDDCASWAGR